MKAVLTVLIMLALLAGVALSQTAPPVLSSCNVTVFFDGTALVQQRWYVLSNPSYMRLNGSSSSSFILVYGLNGTKVAAALAYNYTDGGINLNSQGFLKVQVLFTSSSMTSKSGPLWRISWDYPVPTLVTIPQGAALVNWSATPASIENVNDSVSVLMSSGPGWLQYVLATSTGYVYGKVNVPVTVLLDGRPVASGTTFNLTLPAGSYVMEFKATGYVTQNQTVIVLPGRVQAISITMKQQASPTGEMLALGALVIVLIAGLASAFALWRRPKKVSGEQPLDTEEKMIVEYLTSHGGKAFQSELLSNLPIPKTTLWRNVMSLKEKGVVEVAKVGGQNLVTLKDFNKS